VSMFLFMEFLKFSLNKKQVGEEYATNIFTTSLSLGKDMVKVRSSSSDCSTRFMKVILLEISLVRTSLQFRCTETGLLYTCTVVQLIQS
jgi:hypothetical protein